MNSRLHSIQQHRTALMARAAVQREDVRSLFAVWSGPISLVDRMVGVFQRVRTNPVMIPVAAALLLWLRRRSKLLWAGRLWSVWQVIASIRRRRAS